MAFRHDNTSQQGQSTLLCILPRQGLCSTPPHVSNFPLPGVACDPISPPLMNLINLIPSALQVPLRVARGPSSALCHLSQHLSSQQLPRQQLSATEPHSPDDPRGKPRCHSRRAGKNRPSRVLEKTRASPATMLSPAPKWLLVPSPKLRICKCPLDFCFVGTFIQLSPSLHYIPSLACP